MEVDVLIVTADRVPIKGATVILDGGTPLTTDKSGIAHITLKNVPFTVKASRSNYVEYLVSVSVLQPIPQWDDPGTIFSPNPIPSIVNKITMEIRLGRILPSKTVTMSSDKIDALKISDHVLKSFPLDKNTKHHVNLQFPVPLQNTFTTPVLNPNDKPEYFFMEPDDKDFRLNFWNINFHSIAESPDKRLLKDRSKQLTKGWDDLISSSHGIKPQELGHFTLAEWTCPDRFSGPTPNLTPGLDRYLLGLWRPRTSVVPGSNVGGSVIPRDVIVFFPPETGPPSWLRDKSPYCNSYPYAFNQVDDVDGNDLHDTIQGYVIVVSNYLFGSKFLTQQLLSAGRDVLLIVPIQPSHEWGKLSKASGLSRLISEAVLFDHRKYPNKEIITSKPEIDFAPLRNSQGNLIPTLTSTAHVAPPPLGTVVLASFSAGAKAIKSLILDQSYNLNPHVPPRTWADEAEDSYAADPSSFLASWREIWDFEGSSQALAEARSTKAKKEGPNVARSRQAPSPSSNSWTSNWASILATWQRKDLKRIVRVYHSAYTIPDVTKMRVFCPLVGATLPSAQQVPIAARDLNVDLHGTNGSVVWFSSLTGRNARGKDWDPTTDRPVFWLEDDHQAVPQICFAHAARSGGLRALVYNKGP